MELKEKLEELLALSSKLDSEFATQLKKSILQYAIQGKLVPQIESEESASVLLEKIQQEKQKLVKEGKLKKKDLVESRIFKGEDNKYYEQIGNEVNCIDEEIPFEIPQNWEWVRLKNIGITETGTTPSKSHPEYFGDYISFIGPSNIQKNQIISYSQGISKIGLKYCRCVPANSILQVCIGGSIGKAAITPKEIAFNQQINSISVYSNIEYSYIYYLIITDYFKKVMILRSTGTATPIINRNNWENIIIPLPPLEEQKRIVEKITKINKGIESI